MDSFKEHEVELTGSKVQAHIPEGMTHEQEFENTEQVLPVFLEFIKS